MSFRASFSAPTRGAVTRGRRGVNRPDSVLTAALPQTSKTVKVRRITDETAREIHEFWRKSLRRQGVKSRSSHWNEELLVPWEQLSERAKDLNRHMVKAVLKAIARLA